MRAEIIGIGTEILLGQIPDGNARWISERLAAAGVDVLHHQVVGDNAGRIEHAFREAMERADVVISTGGLGPTEDDITREGLAAALGAKMERHPEIETFLKDKFARLGREMPESNLVQALVPEGCRYILPQRGTAPGLVCHRDSVRVYAVPGVPAEMMEMIQGSVIPELIDLSGEAILSRVIRSTGIAEAKVGELLSDLFESSRNPTLAYLASSAEVKVRLTAKSATPEGAASLIEPVLAEVCERLGDFVFTTRDEELEEAVGRLLAQSGRTLALAESLTGGSLGARITSVAGSSSYFLGSAVVYAPKSKVEVLGVDPRKLESEGAVSRGCVLEMATGARRVFGADLAASLTGAAGPDPHEGKAPGSVWVGLDTPGGAHARGFAAPGDRTQVRRWAEQAALDLLRRHMEGLPLPS